MDTPLFLRGMLLGFAIAAPVGPIGLLCIQRTLNQGRMFGLATGLGAATADAVYGAVAAFGLSIVTLFLVQQQVWLGIVGGVVLCYLGIRTLMAAPAVGVGQYGSAGLLGAYSSTFLLTLTNPMTILAFAAIFAGAGLVTAGGASAASVQIVAGVFCGSAVWWLCLSAGVSLLRARINATTMQWINRIAGAILVSFGVFAIVRSF